MIKETLLKLGLTSNEVEIYLTLLNKGEISVNEIGSSSGLHRQVCYDALDRLLEKGVVSAIQSNVSTTLPNTPFSPKRNVLSYAK